MTVGIRVRNPNTGELRLNLADYTIRQYFSQTVSIAGSGSLAVAGINPTDYGAFMIPCYSYGWPIAGAGISFFLATNPPRMPRCRIEGGNVVWTVGTGHVTANFQIIVVKYR